MNNDLLWYDKINNRRELELLQTHTHTHTLESSTKRYKDGEEGLIFFFFFTQNKRVQPENDLVLKLKIAHYVHAVTKCEPARSILSWHYRCSPAVESLAQILRVGHLTCQ